MKSKIEIRGDIRRLKERMNQTMKDMKHDKSELNKNRFMRQQDKLADLYSMLRPSSKWIKLTILGRPVSSKNSKQIFFNKKTNRPFITNANNVKDWFVLANEQLKKVWQGKKPIGEDVELECEMNVYLGKAQWMDAVNAAQAPLDALQKSGVIINDSRVKKISITMDRDRENPRYEIKIREI